MWSTAKVARSALSQVSRMPVRNASVIPIPCRDRVPMPQMLVMGGFLVSCMVAVPAYILVNIKHYRGAAE